MSRQHHSQQRRTGPAVTDNEHRWDIDPVAPQTLEVKHRAPAFALISRNGCEGFRSAAIDLAKLFAAYLFVFFIGQVTEMPHEAMQAAADRVVLHLGKSLAVDVRA